MQALQQFVTRHRKLLVLTGAGCSTDSGIPDYRDGEGRWKRRKPILYQEFMTSESVRQRYWARSYLGWLPFSQARPNPSHHALAQLESRGRIGQLVTQNVDGLHQKAGSQQVIDLHGRLEQLRCQSCGEPESRHWMQEKLVSLNPWLDTLNAATAPDGDTDLETDFSPMVVPGCPICGGILKPDVVFYGEQVPRSRIAAVYDALHQADALLVAGTSLMVFSAFQFMREAARLGKPIAAINQGKTRADHLFQLKIEQPAGATLSNLVTNLPE
ncbi:NAD-dependent protein deacetylase [Sedimenticola thiotaurini]|uniref:protein acetyllysine N-acetyltransferase n=1 Tax=Sedimenticola thiotaurini TaxID=1543721 RepID=A0A0F7K0Z7_9GAMM|nr:NAD-dependent protein deacetylase [Sedimenticola thiotaurini]AKH20648.1 NAD-dependent deacetylase [Sedimenticola thiotaurini]